MIQKKYIPLKRYFISDSKKGLPHIKKIILSKVIAILRPHDDIIIFLGKNIFQEYRHWKYINFFFLYYIIKLFLCLV